MFVGRKIESSRLVAWIEGEGSLCVVRGLPGVGKSALCTHALMQVDSCQWVVLDAQRWSGELFEALCASLAAKLGVSWEGDEGTLWAYLRTSPHLVFIENAESVAQRELWEVLTEASWQERGVRFLCATRRLDVPEDLAGFELLGMTEDHGAAQALLGDAVEMLDERLRTSLLESLDFHPLSLVLCGAMMRWLGAEQVARRLLDSAHGGVDEHVWSYRRLDEVFASFWKGLDASTQWLLGRVSVMPQPVLRSDMWRLCVDTIDMEQVSERAQRHGGLVQDGPTWHMAQAWRAYCAARFMRDLDAYEEWLRVLAEYYVREYEHVWMCWVRLEPCEPLSRLRRDRETLTWLFGEVSAHDVLDEHTRHTLALVLCVAYMLEERLSEIAPLLWDDVGHVLRVDDVDHALVVQVELMSYELMSTYDDQSIERLTLVWEKLSCARQPLELELDYAIAARLVWAHILRSEMESAQEIIAQMRRKEEAWQAQCVVVPEGVQAQLKMREASLIHQQRQMQEALPLYKEALILAQKGHDRRTQAMIGHNLGVLHTDLCELDRAEDYLSMTRSVEAFLGRALRAMHHLSMGMVRLRRGEVLRAREDFLQSAEVMQRSKLRGSLGIIDYNLGLLALEQGDVDAARACLDAGRRRLEIQQDVMIENSLKMLESNILIEMGSYEKALELNRESALHCEAYGEAMRAVRACFAAGECMTLLLLRRVDEASRLVATWRAWLTSVHEPFLETIWSYLEAMTWLVKSREAKKVKSRQQAWLEWLERARALSHLETQQSSEAVRFIVGVCSRTLRSRERAYWELFFEQEPLAWTNMWVLDPNSGVVLSPHGEWIDLSRHELLFSLLLHLVTHQGEACSSQMLQRALWPGEVMLEEAAHNRLNVALSKLRGAGFASCVVREETGYVFDTSQRCKVLDLIAP